MYSLKKKYVISFEFRPSEDHMNHDQSLVFYTFLIYIYIYMLVKASVPFKNLFVS